MLSVFVAGEESFHERGRAGDAVTTPSDASVSSLGTTTATDLLLFLSARRISLKERCRQAPGPIVHVRRIIAMPRKICMRFVLTYTRPCPYYRQNLDDALAKVQDIINRAVEYVTPKETDPETIKRVKAQ